MPKSGDSDFFNSLARYLCLGYIKNLNYYI